MAGAERKLHPHHPMHTLALLQGSRTGGRKEPTGYWRTPRNLAYLVLLTQMKQ